MKTKTNSNLKKGAMILLILLQLSIVAQFIAFYQTRYQLVSPIIPDSLFLQVVHPFIFMGFISTIISIISLLLYFFEKYLFVIIICGLAILWQQIYPYLVSS